ncbi:MAG: HAD family phosphatase [Leptospiraceae bacterium]|nr:HAD family phosphatase [Leptospiraceae bacterium]
MQPDWRNYKALLFDMDGTLVDSEGNTEIAVREYLVARNLDPDQIEDYQLFHGRTWQNIELLLNQRFAELQGADLQRPLQQRFHELFLSPALPYIAGAPEFLRQASRYCQIAIVTSSNRESAEYLVTRMQLESEIALVMGAEDFSRSKPDPECYLSAARQLDTRPAECMVFEDSQAGLQSALAAGTARTAVGRPAQAFADLNRLADFHIIDFLGL